ncbi:DUF6600 domain-containing protein [uncultured Paludibaculum sp.]|uniref:DUF6600 domain-containing protein n=1 Tax=uncultured Paludibaculum sp. TaxID=1765020 RepID=UPI002AAC24EE|nr:DUF6600 domain-containing protein [uncultured Paludibaculum sp.]
MATSVGFLAAQDPPGRVGRLNYRDGPVSFQPNGVDDWVEAGINRPLTTGDKIWVGDRGRAEFHIGSMALRLGEHSDFEFLNLDDQTVQIRLSEGSLTLRLRNLGPDQMVEIDTPNLAFTARQPGVYRIDANPDSQTTFVTVRDGEGEVTGDGQSFPIYARQRIAVRGADQLEYNLTSAGGADEFDQWCSSRDLREDQSQSARFVSREVPGYDDLDQYGTWANQSGYGQVWMPASVAVGWAPYQDGHWAWIAPWGWTWVDDAPWGFAPYHYGRWASFGGRWGWIPGPYRVAPTYAPAMVAWVGGGRGGSGFSMTFSSGSAPAIGWFPLAPREPYYPSYPVSQRYFTRVNTTNTVINNVTINNYYNSRNTRNSTAVYVNQRVQNGVTAVPESAFASGRRVNQYARPVTAAQVSAIHVAPGPFIVPQRTSVLGAQPESNARVVARPPAAALSRRVVARTAPPPPPVPFDRQQAALARNPGRPLQATEARQLRQNIPAPAAPVRVVDMSRVKRVQPAMHAEPRPGLQPGAPPSPVSERQNVPPGQQQGQPRDPRGQQRQQEQDAQRQLQQKQQQDARERQQQDQQQEAQRQLQLKQQQDLRGKQQRDQQQEAQRQLQQKQQQDARERQQQDQQQEARRQLQQKQQQDARERQQRDQQQEAQRQLQQKQQQDARERQQRDQQQEAQRQLQQKQQQDARERQQRDQQQEAQRQLQQKQQQDARERQQRDQQQEAQRQSQQKQQQEAQERQRKQQQEAQAQRQQKAAPPPQANKPPPKAPDAQQRPVPKKSQKPPE